VMGLGNGPGGGNFLVPGVFTSAVGKKTAK
jgi:hypothetical protein